MTVSVIVPTHNRAYIIREAVESVISQTLPDWELLVVDDGSQDNTPAIMAEFRDQRIRYIRHERNKGISDARNTGLREARGELISFLDSDDAWKPAKLESEADFLKRHPEADAVFTDLEKQDGEKHFGSFMRESPYFSKVLANLNYPNQIVFSQREIYLCLLREVPIKPSALTLRVETARKTGFFDETLPSGEDWEYLLRISRVFRFGYIDEPLSVLRVQKDAWHREHGIAAKPFLLELLKDEIARANGDREVIDAVKWGYSDISKHLAWEYLAKGQKSSAAKTFIGAFRETGDPSMLARALLAYFPSSVRAPLKKLSGRTGN